MRSRLSVSASRGPGLGEFDRVFIAGSLGAGDSNASCHLSSAITISASRHTAGGGQPDRFVSAVELSSQSSHVSAVAAGFGGALRHMGYDAMPAGAMELVPRRCPAAAVHGRDGAGDDSFLPAVSLRGVAAVSGLQLNWNRWH